MLAAVDSALRAWTTCTPNYKIPAQDLPALAPHIAACIPGGRQTSQSARRLQELFEVDQKRSDGRSMFMQMIKEHEGEVHFLYFWRAFSKAVRLIDGGEEGHGAHESLLTEFETLRDCMLRLLDTQASEYGVQDKRPTMTASALCELVVNTSSMSAVPDFWHRCIVALGGPKDDPRQLHLEQLTMVMLSWLWDAVTWHPPIVSQISGPLTGREETTTPGRSRLPVRIHIYDVSHEDSIQQINQVFARKGFPLKMGGAFHVGVEVNNVEWCFGYSESETKSGVGCVIPRKHPNHHFRQSIKMGHTALTAEDIAGLISDLIEEYPGTDYDLLTRNCTHFADDFCQRLGVGSIPGWIHRFADIGTHVVTMLQTATQIRSQVGSVLHKAQVEFNNGTFQPLQGIPCWEIGETPRRNSLAYNAAMYDF